MCRDVPLSLPSSILDAMQKLTAPLFQAVKLNYASHLIESIAEGVDSIASDLIDTVSSKEVDC